MVFLDAPYIIRYTKLVGHIAQILVITYDTWDVAIKLSRLPTSQQIIEAVTHLRHEDRHSRTLVAIVERELHLIALGIESGEIIVELVAWDKESVEFPFYSHKEHTFYLVHILVEIDDVSFVVCYKFRYF